LISTGFIMALPPIIIRLTGQDDGAKALVKGVKDDLGGVGVAARTAAGGTDDLKKSLGGISSGGLGSVVQDTERLSKNVQGLRNFGAGMALAGAGGIMLSNSLARAAMEGDRAQDTMEALFTKQGEGGRIQELSTWAGKLAHDAAMVDDDPIKEAAAGLAGFGMNAGQVMGLMDGLIGQSRLYHQSLEGVSEAVGRAFGKGDIAGLARIGVTLSDEDKARMAAVKDAPQAERQAVMYQVLSASFKQYALSMTEGLSQAEIAANRTALAQDQAQEALGAGAATANTQINSLKTGLANVIAANPGLAAGAGYILTYGSYALTAAGSLIGVGAQIAQLILAKKALDAASAASAAAKLVEAGATTTLAATEVAAAGAAVIETGAVTAAGTASAAAGGAALVGAGGFGALALSIGLIAGVALLAAGAMYALDKALHWKEDREMRANQIKGDEADKKYFDIEQEGGKTRPGETFEQWKTRTGRGAENSEDKATAEPPGLAELKQLQEQIKTSATAPVAAPTAGPQLPSAASPAGLATGGVTASPLLTGGEAATDSGGGAGAENPYQSQIEGLQDELRHAKGKGNAARRAQLQEQMVALRRQSAAWRREHAAEVKADRLAESAAKKAERLAEQQAKKAESRADKVTRMEAGLQEVETEERYNTDIARLEGERDAAQESKDTGRAADLTKQIAVMNAQKERDAALARIAGMDDDDPLAKDIERRKAQRHFEGALERAEMVRGKADSGQMRLASLLARLRAGGSLPDGKAAAGTGSLALTSAMPNVDLSMPGGGAARGAVATGAGGGNAGTEPQTLTARAKQSYDAARHRFLIQFEQIAIDDVYARDAAML